MKFIPLTLISILFFVFPIPGTNALRYLLAITLLVFAIFNLYSEGLDKLREILASPYLRNFFLILSFLTVYIILHSIFISHEIYWSLKEFKGHWINPLLFLFLGIFLAMIAKKEVFFTPRSLITSIFFGMFLNIIYLDFEALKVLFTSGYLISREGGLTGSPVLLSYLTNILLAFVLAELVSRNTTQVRTLQVSNFWLFIILFLLLFSIPIEGMRNGSVGLFLSILVASYFYLYKEKSKAKVIFITLTTTIIFSLPLIHSLHFDKRWSSFFETIPIALDTETNKYWQDEKYELPRLSNGQPVSVSNYQRIAWASKGVDYILDDPIGIGFGRNAFGHAIQLNDGIEIARGYHSHSSIIDLTIGLGIAGLILWLVLIYYLLTLFFKSFIDSSNFYALSGFLITSGFFVRSFVDSNMRDHMFQQFFILLGVFICLSTYKLLKKNET